MSELAFTGVVGGVKWKAGWSELCAIEERHSSMPNWPVVGLRTLATCTEDFPNGLFGWPGI
jgi:hypothetical protein